MGPTKVIVKGAAIYDAKTDKLLIDGLATRKALEDYATHHYIALPVVDHAGRLWMFEGAPVYCLHGATFETLHDEAAHLRRCLDCGGMAVPTDEVTVERGCVRCTQCSHEFDARLEMMES